MAHDQAFYRHSKHDCVPRRTDAQVRPDFMNHNDTKIGKDCFVMKLEEAGVACYDYGDKGPTTGNKAPGDPPRTPSCHGFSFSSPSSTVCWAGSSSSRSQKPKGLH